jgi:hypothetical protein
LVEGRNLIKEAIMAKAKTTKRRTHRAYRAHRAQKASAKSAKHETSAMRGEVELKLKADPASPRRASFKKRLDGIMRDPVLWHGVPVSYVKQISRNEPGYDPNALMVLIEDKDGNQFQVPIEEISELYVPPTTVTERPKRVPHETFVGGVRTPTA